MRKILVSVILAFACSAASLAGGLPDGLGLKVRAGYSVGGTAPLEMPAAIRSFDSYHLTPSVMVGADVSYAFTERWGLLSGLRLQTLRIASENSPSRNSPRGLSAKRFDIGEKVKKS